MGSDKIRFISTLEGLESIEECRPKPAKHFVPKWFKDIPRPTNDIPDVTVKACPSFPDYFSLGYIIPMWSDCRLSYIEKEGKWNILTSTHLTKWKTHDNHQFIDFVTPTFNGVEGQFVFKTVSPWMIATPPGWSVLQLPLFYHFNQEWSVLPGVIDTDIHNEINQQVLYHGDGKDIQINRGDPFVLYVPFKRDSVKLDMDINYVTEEDYKMINNRNLFINTKFISSGMYRRLQRLRDKDNNG